MVKNVLVSLIDLVSSFPLPTITIREWLAMPPMMFYSTLPAAILHLHQLSLPTYTTNNLVMPTQKLVHIGSKQAGYRS